MKNYTKKQFFQEVTDEIENIKKFATDKEKQKLDFDNFDPDFLTSCIYGQLTGDCESDRAIKLIRKCCKRYFHFEENDLYFSFDDKTFKDVKIDINGIEMPDDFILDNLRNYEYHSLLEGFIRLRNANNKNIISYIKGDKEKLILEKK